MTDSHPWFSRLIRHLARKRRGSILTTRSPHGWQTGIRCASSLNAPYPRSWDI